MSRIDRKKGASKKSRNKQHASPNQPWLPTRTGLIVLAIATFLLAVWTTLQAVKVSGLGESILWGLGFAASIWVIFGVVFFINKWLRGR